jgi:hypothetical protein
LSVQYTVELADGRSFGPADEATLRTWAEEGRVPAIAKIVANDGTTCRAIDCAPIAGIVSRIAAAPPTAAGPMPQQDDTGVSKVIPYKNGAALAGYYTSIAALIPLVGLIAGPIAVVLGIQGLKAVKSNPKVHGTVHAWVAIVLGTGCFLLYALLILVPLLVAAFSH